MVVRGEQATAERAALTLDDATERSRLLARRDGRPACVVEVKAGRRLALVGRAPAGGWLYYQAASFRGASALVARYRDFAGRTGTDVASAIVRVVHVDGRVVVADELVEQFAAGLVAGAASGAF